MLHPVALALWVVAGLTQPAHAVAPAAPAVVGTLAASPGDRPAALAVAGNRAYVLTAGDGAASTLVVVDVSTPATPRVVGRTPLPFAARRVVARKGLAYLATADPARELAVLDVADDAAARVLATLDLPGALEATAIDLAEPDVDKRPLPVVYVGTRRGDGAELHTVLVAEPSKPRALGAFEVGADVRDLAVRHNAAYLATADPTRELVVFDGVGPGALTERGARDLPGDAGATAVEVEHGRVWVTTPNQTAQPDLHLLDDGSGTGAPVLRASLDLGADDGDVTAQGARAFVAARTSSRALTVVRAAGTSARVADTVGSAAPAVAVGLGPRHVYLAGAPGAPLLQVVDPGAPLAAVADGNGDGLVTVVCLGDSNTMFDHVGGQRRAWCEQLDDAIANPNWHVVNRSLLGMTAVDLGRMLGELTMYVDAPTPHPVTIDATLRLDRADVVVLAFGTNDLRAITNELATPEQLVAAYQAHERKLRAGGVPLVLIALTPPTVPPSPASDLPRIDAANALLRRTFPADRLLDFSTGMVPADYGYRGEHDGVHIGQSGQRKRMETAYRRLVSDDDLFQGQP